MDGQEAGADDTDDYDSEEESEEVRRDRESQQNDLEHLAQMFVLKSQNAYLLREFQLETIQLQSVTDEKLKIREAVKLRARELSKLKKARIRNEKLKHAQNRREMNSVAGYFYNFWRWIEVKETTRTGKEAKNHDVFGTPDFSLEEFWFQTK